MSGRYYRTIGTALALAVLSAPAAFGEDLWSLFEPACNANGIDPDKCACVLDRVVKAHGEQAARYVGLDMSLRHEESQAILDVIGEEAAFAAGAAFDVEENTTCSPARAAQLVEEFSGAPSSTATGAAIAAEQD